MTREHVSRTLSYMERLREDAMEADSERKRRAMIREYGQLWKSIEPFVTGKEPYSEPPSRKTG